MGVRKKNKAQLIKEANKKLAFAKLMKCPTSPRKMRLVADQIRGIDVNIALNILKTDSFKIYSDSFNFELQKNFIFA